MSDLTILSNFQLKHRKNVINETIPMYTTKIEEFHHCSSTVRRANERQLIDWEHELSDLRYKLEQIDAEEKRRSWTRFIPSIFFRVTKYEKVRYNCPMSKMDQTPIILSN